MARRYDVYCSCETEMIGFRQCDPVKIRLTLDG